MPTERIGICDSGRPDVPVLASSRQAIDATSSWPGRGGSSAKETGLPRTAGKTQHGGLTWASIRHDQALSRSDGPSPRPSYIYCADGRRRCCDRLRWPGWVRARGPDVAGMPAGRLVGPGHAMTSPPGALPMLSLRACGARCSKVTRAACVTRSCSPARPVSRPRTSAVLSHGYRKTRLPPSMLLVGLYNVVELSSFACR
jgi:hypothetical protein